MDAAETLVSLLLQLCAVGLMGSVALLFVYGVLAEIGAALRLIHRGPE